MKKNRFENSKHDSKTLKVKRNIIMFILSVYNSNYLCQISRALRPEVKRLLIAQSVDRVVYRRAAAPIFGPIPTFFRTGIGPGQI